MFLNYWDQHNASLVLTISFEFPAFDLAKYQPKWLYQLNQAPSMQRHFHLLSITLDIRLLLKKLCLWPQNTCLLLILAMAFLDCYTN
jgi:hypothetical protein